MCVPFDLLAVLLGRTYTCEVICVHSYSRLFIPSVVCDGKRLDFFAKDWTKYPSLGELVNFGASAVVECRAAINKHEETRTDNGGY